MAMILDLEQISFRYPKAEAAVFERLSLRLVGPGFHALFGPSGVGKTTLALMIAGEMVGFKGRITRQDLARVLYTYNLERLPNWSSVGEHFTAVTPAGRGELYAELVDVFGLQPCLEARFSELSLGQRNRANLVRYLVQDFDLLIMDESLANVDENTKRQIILKIKAAFPERTFLYISHNVVEVSRYCRQIVVLRGRRQDPQALTVTGLDFAGAGTLDRKELEPIMLEIMHAA
jgi:ABC-type nitrate/sulfonate/bicarbonate transport system ATPase subunit